MGFKGGPWLKYAEKAGRALARELPPNRTKLDPGLTVAPAHLPVKGIKETVPVPGRRAKRKEPRNHDAA